MTDFRYKVNVSAPLDWAFSSAFEDNTGAIDDDDIGKAVRLDLSADNSAMLLCVDGEYIDGFITAVEAFNVNSGWSFGTVTVPRRVEVQVGAAQALSVGQTVVAFTQAAAGAAGTAQVKADATTAADIPADQRHWRCISNVSKANGGVIAAAAGDTVLLELI
ncbi:MAG: hypothetical protein KAJ03_07460 [Gammaproteobacteria bacterium]|nr:hypothetical protein [Gammaproteobacteria bacterium]